MNTVKLFFYLQIGANEVNFEKIKTRRKPPLYLHLCEYKPYDDNDMMISAIILSHFHHCLLVYYLMYNDWKQLSDHILEVIL